MPSIQAPAPIVGSEDEFYLPSGYSTYNGQLVSPEEVQEILASLGCHYEVENDETLYGKVSVLFRHDVPSELSNREMPIKVSAKLFGLRE